MKNTITLEFRDAEDLKYFTKYMVMAKEQGGTITGLYAGLMCSALKRSTPIDSTAPDLLEACKAICLAVSDCLPISGNGPVDVLYYKSQLLAIDQAASVCSEAISKAEGNA